VQITRDGSAGAMKIGGTVDIGVAATLHAALREYLGEAEAPALDLSGVEACDATAFQLFYAARKTAEGAGKRLGIVAPSPAVESAAADLGLDLAALRGEGDGD